MDSRTSILDTIKKSIADIDKTKVPAPELPPIWDHKGLSKEELIKVFSESVKSVAGEAVLCSTPQDAAAKISQRLKEFVQDSQQNKPYILGTYSSDLIKSLMPEILASLPDWKAEYAPENPDADPQVYQHMTASLVSPIVLLADTGSCSIEARSAFERFLCYLSPKCLVVAKASQLREHLPDAWDEIETKMKSMEHGEVAIVTGPSRTADIEKKLVLGVHGPQKLIVFILQD